MSDDSIIDHESFDTVEDMNKSIEDEIEITSIEEDVGKGQLAVGYRVPTSIKTSAGFLDNVRNLSDIYNDIYQQMTVANKLYKYNSIVGNAVDVLTEFAVSPISILPTKSKKLDNILAWWFENLNIQNTNGLPGIYPLLHEIVLEWFTSGNAFPYQKWENVTIPKNAGQVKLPTSINLLNPQSIVIPDAPLAFGQEMIYLKPDSQLIQKLLADGRTDPEAALLKAAIPRSIVNSIKSTRGFGQGNIRLNGRFVDHLKRKAKGYQAWGVPYLTRAFEDAALLERLRQMDESIASGIINLVTIFKIGTEDHPANQARLRKFASLLRNPKASTTLVWAHDIEVIQKGPDGKLLQFDKKYKEAKDNLLIALGVPPVLNSINAAGDPWVSILALIERLQEWRKVITIWLTRMAKVIAIENGFGDQEINMRWQRMNLQDDVAVKNLLLSFYDRGLLTVKDALEESGRNYKSIKEQKKIEKDSGVLDLFTPPEQPFQGGKTSDGRPPGVSPKSSKESTNKTKTKTNDNVNLKVTKKKTPSSKVK